EITIIWQPEKCIHAGVCVYYYKLNK
ncbi:MAG: (4Fe-4S)-binding protein, partial [Bacteroidales bacterium]|nr:(4Fe-4S)-binding protein [Bacteroidales bacterium]